MIIVRLQGGLGNQMFQYALGRTLALQHGTELLLDVRSLVDTGDTRITKRGYDLGAFAITARIATDDEVRALAPRVNILRKLVRATLRRVRGDTTNVFDPKILETPDNTHLEGYWQSPRYFEAIRDTLVHEFKIKEIPSQRDTLLTIQETESVAIHVRRGDYVHQQRVSREFGTCSPEYFENAIEYIRKRVMHPRFFVFSDDIHWAREHLALEPGTTYVSDGDEGSAPIDFELMRSCKHQIIANSSFSWWAAWLNQNPKKIVVAPTPWFDRVRYDDALLPPEWHTIPK